jgi:hypothetical protein
MFMNDSIMSPNSNFIKIYMFRQCTIIFLLFCFIPITYCKADSISIGSTGPGGGIVFYIDKSGIHGLEAQRADAGVFSWDSAMEAASAYGAGWRLPTLTELNLLYKQNTVVGIYGGTFADTYWSSTERSDSLWTTSPCFKSFYSTGGFIPGERFYRPDQYGYEGCLTKYSMFKARAIRSF